MSAAVAVRGLKLDVVGEAVGHHKYRIVSFGGDKGAHEI